MYIESLQYKAVFVLRLKYKKGFGAELYVFGPLLSLADGVSLMNSTCCFRFTTTASAHTATLTRCVHSKVLPKAHNHFACGSYLCCLLDFFFIINPSLTREKESYMRETWHRCGCSCPVPSRCTLFAQWLAAIGHPEPDITREFPSRLQVSTNSWGYFQLGSKVGAVESLLHQFTHMFAAAASMGHLAAFL